MRLEVSKIKILPEFAATQPYFRKMEECEKFYLDHHKLDRYIAVNKDGYLVDGYIGYLVAKKYGIDKVRIKRSDIKLKNPKINYWFLKSYRRTYVFGRHVGQSTDKEYVWYLPDSKIGVIDISPGDLVLAETKYGVMPVNVTKVKELGNSPVNIKVKKIVKKIEKMEGKYEIFIR